MTLAVAKAPLQTEYPPLVLTFGGGINSRQRPADLNVAECVTGENFDLDSQLASYRNRRAFDLIATATNGERHRRR